MARVTRITTVCDGCGNEDDTTAFRLGAVSGNVKPLDLCPACQGKPFAAIFGMVTAVRTRGRRPGTVTPEQLEKIKADRAAAAAVEHGQQVKAPRKRAARKVAATKAE
jgi:hypothetical protein